MCRKRGKREELSYTASHFLLTPCLNIMRIVSCFLSSFSVFSHHFFFAIANCAFIKISWKYLKHINMSWWCYIHVLRKCRCHWGTLMNDRISIGISARSQYYIGWAENELLIYSSLYSQFCISMSCWLLSCWAALATALLRKLITGSPHIYSLEFLAQYPRTHTWICALHSVLYVSWISQQFFISFLAVS